MEFENLPTEVNIDINKICVNGPKRAKKEIKKGKCEC